MQKLLERTVGTEYKKRIFLYGTAIAALIAVILVSAVVLNTNALLLDENHSAKAQSSKIADGLTAQNTELGLLSPKAETAAQPISATVNVDGEKVVVTLSQHTVKDALLEAGVVLFDDDAVTPDLDSSVSQGDTVTVSRAKSIKVIADGKTSTVRLAVGKVSDALSAAKINLGQDDTVSPQSGKSLEDGMNIKVSRVTYAEKTIRETVRYKTVTTENKSMAYGKEKVTQKGVNGEKEVTYRIKYVNGTESDKTVLSEKTLKEPVNKKVTVGTKTNASAVSGGYHIPSQISWFNPPASIKFDKNGRPTNYTKIMSGTATAYGPQDGTATSTGKKAQPGYVAVDPRVIPYGTKMYIVSADGKYNYGYAIAADTGGAARSGRILVDLFFPSERACYNFGRRQVNIYILP